MELSLHRALKERRYGPESGGRLEVVVDGFRVDAVAADGTLIEVQSASLGPLRAKLGRLLPGHRVRVIKPVVLSRRVIRRARPDGPDLSARLSPRRGRLIDVFDDLVGLTRIFPHPNLGLDVLGVEIDEIRIPRRRRPGFDLVDRRLRQVVSTVTLAAAADLWRLLPQRFDGPFTTRDLADRFGCPLALAQRVAYCLQRAGEAERSGTRKRFRVYAVAGVQKRPESVSGKPT